jgi:putative hemolysin
LRAYWTGGYSPAPFSRVGSLGGWLDHPLSVGFGLPVGASVAAAILATALGALFAGADSAVSALPTTRLAALLDQDEVEHRAGLERIRDDVHALRSAYLAGRILAAAIVTVVIAPPIGTRVAGGLGVTLIVVASTVLLAPTFLIAASIGRTRGDLAGLIVRWLRPLELLLWPLAFPLSRLASRMTIREDADDTPVTETDKRIAEAEVEAMVDRVEEAGLVGAEPAEMIRNVLELADLRARDIMIARAKVEAIERKTPLAEVRRLIAESGHSRYPVYDIQLDNVVGLLVAKDVFKAEADEVAGLPAKKLSDLVRTPVNFVHEAQSLVSILREMRGKRQHLAIVVDEFGGVSGVVTLEDVLEEIVGDIHDEHDEVEAAPIREIGDGHLIAEAEVSLDDLSAYLGTELPEDRRFVSLGGFLMHHTGGVPEVGTSLAKHGYRFTVVQADDTRVESVEIVREPETEDPTSSDRARASMRKPSSRPPIEPAPDTKASTSTDGARAATPSGGHIRPTPREAASVPPPPTQPSSGVESKEPAQADGSQTDDGPSARKRVTSPAPPG